MKFINYKNLLLVFTVLVISCSVFETVQVKNKSGLLGFFDNLFTKSINENTHIDNKFLKETIPTPKSQNKESELEKQVLRFAEVNAEPAKADDKKDEKKDDKKEAGILEGELRISSYDFLNEKRYPLVNLPGKGDSSNAEDIKINSDKFRINLKTTKDMKKPDLNFYFRMNKDHIYYSANKEDLNVLGAIDIDEIQLVLKDQIDDSCFNLTMTNKIEYKICGKDFTIRNKFYCGITERKKIEDEFCVVNTEAKFKPTLEIDNKVYQPIILIPQSAEYCNENFDYSGQGLDWKCTCEEGKEQSPIDIVKSNAFRSPAAPVFYFNEVEAISPLTSLDGTMVAREHIKIKYYKNAIRIFHTNFGKIVTLDGTVYVAEEIVFHTPAEHLLDGIRHEMEMQVIAYGQSKGDIAKQVVVSFIFEKKPGSYNKFIDDVDFFNLPNKENPEKNIVNNLYIPKVFYSSDSQEMVTIKSYSLYTYQGSITFPPCTERTIHYVTADPIPIGHAMISMLKEAIRTSDDQAPQELQNSRATQPLNGRPVYFYDASDCNKADFPEQTGSKFKGHYEKIQKKITQYFRVDQVEPSGIPDSFVVTENEAKGIPTTMKKVEDK